jgi:hypothetical protein
MPYPLAVTLLSTTHPVVGPSTTMPAPDDDTVHSRTVQLSDDTWIARPELVPNTTADRISRHVWAVTWTPRAFADDEYTFTDAFSTRRPSATMPIAAADVTPDG